LITTRHGSLFSVRTNVAAPVTAKALEEVMSELDRIHQPATDDEVVRARNLTALSFPSTFDSGRSTAHAWSEIVSLGIDKKRVDAFLKDTPKVDAAGLKGAADRLVQPDHETVVLVGDVDKVKSELARFGPLTMWTAEDLLPGLTDAAAAAPQQ
jgi:predicted Zn-dependent peptidase